LCIGKAIPLLHIADGRGGNITGISPLNLECGRGRGGVGRLLRATSPDHHQPAIDHESQQTKNCGKDGDHEDEGFSAAQAVFGGKATKDGRRDGPRRNDDGTLEGPAFHLWRTRFIARGCRQHARTNLR